LNTEISNWPDSAGNTKNDISDLIDPNTETQQTFDDFKEEDKYTLAMGGELPKDTIISDNSNNETSSSNNNSSLGTLEQVKEYLLETSEGTNAIEKEATLNINFFGYQYALHIAFGVDNNGHCDLAVEFNAIPTTDNEGIQGSFGETAVKAWDVESVNTLVSGSSTSLVIDVRGKAGRYHGGINYGQGNLHTNNGEIPFTQISFDIPIEYSSKSPAKFDLNISADHENAVSLSELITGPKNGVNLSYFGKAIYAFSNYSWGNAIDAIALNKGKQ
jgi:hypothetical protein